MYLSLKFNPVSILLCGFRTPKDQLTSIWVDITMITMQKSDCLKEGVPKGGVVLKLTDKDDHNKVLQTFPDVTVMAIKNTAWKCFYQDPKNKDRKSSCKHLVP